MTTAGVWRSATDLARSVTTLRAFLNNDLRSDERILMVTHGIPINDLTEFVSDENDIAVVKADGKGGIVAVASRKP